MCSHWSPEVNLESKKSLLYITRLGSSSSIHTFTCIPFFQRLKNRPPPATPFHGYQAKVRAGKPRSRKKQQCFNSIGNHSNSISDAPPPPLFPVADSVSFKNPQSVRDFITAANQEATFTHLRENRHVHNGYFLPRLTGDPLIVEQKPLAQQIPFHES